MDLVEQARRAPGQAAGWKRALDELTGLGADSEAVRVASEALGGALDDRLAVLRAATGAAERVALPSMTARWLEELLRAAPGATDVALRLAVVEARAGRPQAARARVREVVGPGHCSPARGQVTRGWIELHTGSLEHARVLGLLALEGDPARAARLLGLVLALQGRLQRAVDHLRGALGERPDDPETLLLLGQVLLMGGRAAAATDVLDRVLRLRSRHPDALLWSGMALAAEGRTEPAAVRLADAARAGRRAAHLPLGLMADGAGRVAHLRAYLLAFPSAPAQHPARVALREARRR